MNPDDVFINALGVLCNSGKDTAEIASNLQRPPGELVASAAYGSDLPIPVGAWQGALPDIPFSEKKWQTRNNRFALAALHQIEPELAQARKQYGSERIGVVIGTSTAGIADSELHIRDYVEHGEVPDAYDYCMQEMGASAEFVARAAGTNGPIFGISTACSSGAKALASARRLIRTGICDAVVAGGVDTLCQLTVRGFSSLEAVSDTRCNPFSRNRRGINIGEAAALFLVSREPAEIALRGVGESSDAHHISAPDPSGAGAAACMQAALDDAGLPADAIDYVNLHGTATRLNDEMESIAVNAVFPAGVPCSSTKAYTGHTLGAAGALEAGIAWLAIRDGFLPLHHWDGEADSALPTLDLVDTLRDTAAPRTVLSNSFAFGGNNIAIILGSHA